MLVKSPRRLKAEFSISAPMSPSDSPPSVGGRIVDCAVYHLGSNSEITVASAATDPMKTPSARLRPHAAAP